MTQTVTVSTTETTVSVAETAQDVTVTPLETTVTIQQGSVSVVTAALQGPPGPTGPAGSGSSLSITRAAGQDLSGHRAVRVAGEEAFYASADTQVHAGRVVGITTGAALTGADATIQVGGEMTELSWSWSDGPIFLGLDGQLTQTPPTAGFVQQVATAITSTRILIDVRPPLLRV